MSSPSLETLLFGRPLVEHDHPNSDIVATDVAALNAVLAKMIDHFNSEYPRECEGRQHVVHELRGIQSLTNQRHALTAKRAVVCMFFMREEQAALRIFGTNAADRRVVVRVGASIMPLLVPPFVQHLAQRPDKLLYGASVLWRMWDDVEAKDEETQGQMRT